MNLEEIWVNLIIKACRLFAVLPLYADSAYLEAHVSGDIPKLETIQRYPPKRSIRVSGKHYVFCIIFRILYFMTALIYVSSQHSPSIPYSIYFAIGQFMTTLFFPWQYQTAIFSCKKFRKLFERIQTPLKAKLGFKILNTSVKIYFSLQLLIVTRGVSMLAITYQVNGVPFSILLIAIFHKYQMVALLAIFILAFRGTCVYICHSIDDLWIKFSVENSITL